MKPNDTTELWRDDPIVEEVRAVRARLVADVGGDLDALFASLKASQDLRSGRQIHPPSKAQGQDADAA